MTPILGFLSRCSILAWLGIQFVVASEPPQKQFNIRDYGAIGDGITLDSPAINKAIDAAAIAGGGTVVVPGGRYFSGSIRMKSNIHLRIDKGAVIVADRWNSASFDPTESVMPPAYQDEGHTFFRNSLIWGEHLTNISITGEGMIDGTGLINFHDRLDQMTGFGKTNESNPGSIPKDPTPPVLAANKSISLKLCKNVVIRDITIFRGGWFAILVTGCDDMVMENLTIDTNRDGIDIDCCHNVMVKNCRINSPGDDAICPKSSYALGYPRLTENLTIKDCEVSGFEVGTMLDGTKKPCVRENGQGGNGRIKFGTESSGGFRNCIVTKCTFISCMGLALEVVDGGILENITVSDLKMTDVVHYALYIVTGERNRTPNLTTASRMKNVSISDVVAEGVDVMSGIQIFGMHGHPIENLYLKNIRLLCKGGGTKEDAAIVPKDLGTRYPDPSDKGRMPAYGIFARHVKGLKLIDLDINLQSPDLRPVAQFENIDGLEIDNFKTPDSGGAQVAKFATDVRGLTIRNSPGMEGIR